MALTQLSSDLNIIQALDDQPNDVGGLTAAELKAKFDEAAGLIKTFLNSTLIAELEATTDSSSGADQIGATTISGITGSTVQAILESIVSAGSGSLPADGTISNAKLATDVKVGSLASLTTTEKGSVVGAINEVDSNVDTHTGDTANPHSVTAAQAGAPTAQAGAQNIWVQSTAPTAIATGDIWIDTA